MHVSETEFNARMNPEMYFGYTCPNMKLESTKEFIEKLKKINSADPGFLYTCSKDIFKNSYVWHFSYTDKDTYEKAMALAIDDVKTDRIKDGYPDDEDDIYGDTLLEKECACPFLG